MEFLTQGEKLKRLRLQLNLRQKDLSDDKVTREFISMVEKGKRNFSRNNAVKVMQKILILAEEKNIDLDLDEDYLARDIDEDAELYCIRRVENKADLEECQRLLKIAEEHNAHYATSRIFKRMGEIYLYAQEAVKAFISYSRALEILNNTGKVTDKPLIFNNMGVCKLKLVDYEEAVYYFNSSLLVAELTGNYSVYNKALYNLALAYSALKNNKDTLLTINRCLNRLDKSKEYNLYLKIRILEAFSYSEENKDEIGFEIYKELEEDFLDISYLTNEDKIVMANLYNNMGYTLLVLERYKESEYYFDKSSELREIYGRDSLSHTLIMKSMLYIKTKAYDKALICLNKGIELCREYNDYEYWNTALKELEKIYILRKNSEGLRDTYLEYIQLSYKNDSENTRIYGYSKLIRLELGLGNILEAMKYSDKLNAYIEEIQSNIQLQW